VEPDAEVCPNCGCNIALRPETELRSQGGPAKRPEGALEQQNDPESTPSSQLLFGRFRVLDLLGRGGMGEVYRCHDEVLRRERAVKRLLPELTRDEEARERFREEVRTAQEIAHPHVVNVLEFLPDAEQPGFSMELLKGATLAEHVEGRVPDSPLFGPGTPDRLPLVATIVAQLAEAVDHVHDLGLVHRDIKPSNVMICGTLSHPTVKLLDFGIVHVRRESCRTQFGQPGWGPYMADELVWGKPATAAADLFSLGRIVYLLLTGEEIQYLADHEPPSALVEGLPQDVDRIVAACLGRLDRRPKNAAVLTAALRGESTGQDRPPPLPTPPPERVYHYHGPSGRQRCAAEGIADLVASDSKAEHLLWWSGEGEWRSWSEVAVVAALVEERLVRSEPEDRAAAEREPHEAKELEVRERRDIYRMVVVEPGTFLMGSPNDDDDRSGGETPQHEVHVSIPFEIGAVPVTQMLYVSVMGDNPSHFKGENRPVEKVSWCDAVLFCNRLSERDGLSPAYRVPVGLVAGMSGPEQKAHAAGIEPIPGANGFRLPSEAEWEFAARAGTRTRYWSGDAETDLAHVGWYAGNSSSKTHPVGQTPPNAWGLHDVHGNVWEWCEDDWHDRYVGAPSDGSAWVDGPRGSGRVIRGGSWYVTASNARVANRSRNAPFQRRGYLGFRLARSAGNPRPTDPRAFGALASPPSLHR